MRSALLIIGLLVTSRLNGDNTEIVLPRECLTKVELGPETWCGGPDINNLTCYKIVITYKKGCEQVHLVK